MASVKTSMKHKETLASRSATVSAASCRRKFLRFFPGGFRDETYIDWERDYKWKAHERWNEELSRTEYRKMLQRGEFTEIIARAVRIDSRRGQTAHPARAVRPLLKRRSDGRKG